MSNFTQNKLTFDYARCMKMLEIQIDASLSELSDKVIELFRKEIDENGNGSSIMRADAKAAVREISRKIESSIVEMEIGVDEDFARQKSIDFYIRTMVVIHGNLERGNGKLFTKPGQYTWRKHVRDYHLNVFSKKVKRLKPLEQKSRSKNVLNGVMQNVSNQTNKYFKDWRDQLERLLDDGFWSQFLTVG